MRLQSLVIAQPFLNYSKGQEIFDKDEIEKILSGENAICVIKSSYQKFEALKNQEEKTENKISEKKETLKKQTRFSPKS